MLRFVEAKDLWHKQIAVYNSWNKQGEHAPMPPTIFRLAPIVGSWHAIPHAPR